MSSDAMQESTSFYRYPRLRAAYINQLLEVLGLDTIDFGVL